MQLVARNACGVGLILLSLRRGPIVGTYAGWQPLIR